MTPYTLWFMYLLDDALSVLHRVNYYSSVLRIRISIKNRMESIGYICQHLYISARFSGASATPVSDCSTV